VYPPATVIAVVPASPTQANPALLELAKVGSVSENAMLVLRVAVVAVPTIAPDPFVPVVSCPVTWAIE